MKWHFENCNGSIEIDRGTGKFVFWPDCCVCCLCCWQFTERSLYYSLFSVPKNSSTLEIKSNLVIALQWESGAESKCVHAHCDLVCLLKISVRSWTSRQEQIVDPSHGRSAVSSPSFSQRGSIVLTNEQMSPGEIHHKRFSPKDALKKTLVTSCRWWWIRGWEWTCVESLIESLSVWCSASLWI